MLKKVFSIALVLALAIGAFGSVIAAVASARTLSWVVSVTYQNVGAEATSVNVDFYQEGSSTPISFDPLNGGTLAPGAGASFFIGSVSGIDEGFRGNAVLSSSQPVVATVVQFHQNAAGETVKMRLLSNGFQATDGSQQYLVATTLLNKFSRTTVFSVQNTQSTPVTATIRFYDADAGGALASTINHTIPGFSSKYIEMDKPADTGLAASKTVFNGSAIVTVPSGAVVSAASELYTNRDVAANFEGVSLDRAANTIYLATALCQRFGLDTFYAVQNASTTAGNNATITVTYRNLDGTTKTTDGPYTIGAGQKRSITTCTPSSGAGMVGFTGSAVIQSTGAPIAVIGKAQCSTAPGTCPAAQLDVFTAFMGERAGASKLAMPFIRWANNTDFNAASNLGGRQRAFIAIQNLETSTITVNVKYYGKAGGAPLATQTLTIPGLAKANSDASAAGALGLGGMSAGSFGYYPDSTFGGSVIVEAAPANPTAKFIAVVRVQHPGAGEDYNAVPAP